MRRPGWIGSVRPPGAERPPGSLRDSLAVLLALVTVICLGSAFFLSERTQSLMPGPLASAHGAIENCSACHTKSGSGKLSWIHGLVAGDPLADSKACLSCHKMPDTAFNAHGASIEVLRRSTQRLTKIAAGPTPQSARAQNIAFPTHNVVARGLYCATCHQEHQGVNFKLSKISNEQCGSCHVVKFDSFDGQHPKFDNYPFRQRTRIIYDHAGHFGKHFPEVAKKNPTRRIPDTCSTCHNSRKDKRVMAVAPFEQTCTTCHLNQIIGKERASGPKGIAFLTVPGLDLQTLKKKNAPIGEWPDASEAALTPFMKVMIGRDERGRALIRTVDSLNLQDLSHASDDQIKAVTRLVWEIKGLFYALIKGKASDVLGNLNIASGAELSANLVADLTASIPRDVVVGAQQEWLPNLAKEMANRRDSRDQSRRSSVITESRMAPTASLSPVAAGLEAHAEGAGGATDSASLADDGRQTLAADESDGTTIRRWSLPSGTPRAIEAARNKDANKAGQSEGAAGKADTEAARSKDAEKAAQPRGAAGKTDTENANRNGGEELPSADEQPQNPADQSDDLLFLTQEELRAIKAEKAAPPEGAAGKADTANTMPDGAASAGGTPKADAPANAPATSDAAPAEPRKAAPVISIESDIDPESWAEYGGWYRQDYAIFYRPTGHKDKFIYSWLFLTGPQAPKGGTSPAAAVFDFLTAKDAQGACTECHSVDDIQGKGRLVNFSPPSVESKQGRFTNFIHEPHFGIMENRGCLTCHELAKGRPYLKSYEQGNPQNFISNFGAVKKNLCQSCHTSTMARQDCLLCHKYHVNGVITPIINTKIPTQ